MKLKLFIICFIVFAALFQNISWGVPITTPETWQDKVDDCLEDYIKALPHEYFNFVTREAAACRLRIKVGTLEAKTVALATHWTATSTREITIGSVSTWESVNIENLVHELTHAGAGSAGSGEVAARKAEAMILGGMPPISQPEARGKIKYDMVYNKDGTQRSHDQIKKKLKTYGYSQSKM